MGAQPSRSKLKQGQVKSLAKHIGTESKMAQMSLCLLFSLVTMGVAVRSESESESLSRL